MLWPNNKKKSSNAKVWSSQSKTNGFSVLVNIIEAHRGVVGVVPPKNIIAKQKLSKSLLSIHQNEEAIRNNHHHDDDDDDVNHYSATPKRRNTSNNYHNNNHKNDTIDTRQETESNLNDLGKDTNKKLFENTSRDSVTSMNTTDRQYRDDDLQLPFVTTITPPKNNHDTKNMDETNNLLSSCKQKSLSFDKNDTFIPDYTTSSFSTNYNNHKKRQEGKKHMFLEHGHVVGYDEEEEEDDDDDVSKGEEEDDDDDDDDDESMSYSKDIFEDVLMYIHKEEGTISFEYLNVELETSKRQHADNNNNHYDETPEMITFQTNLIQNKDTKDLHSNTNHSNNNNNNNNNNNSDDDNNLDTESIEAPQFELAVTNHRAETEQKQQNKEKIRLAVLKIAADAYRNLNIDVPDILLAQMNKTRNMLKEDKGRMPILNDIERLFSTAVHNHRNEHTMITTKNKTDDFNNNTTTTNNSENQGKINQLHDQREEQKLPTSSLKKIQAEKVESNKKKEKIVLSKSDEIHCSPCQCALSLVGLKGTRQCSQIDGQNMELAIGITLFGLGETSSPEKTKERNSQFSKQNYATQISNNNAEKYHQFRFNPTSSTITTSKFMMHQIQSEKQMVRTVSAQAAKVSSSDNLSIAKQIPPCPSRQKRSFSISNTFSSLGYHEITLIRNRDASDHTKKTGIHSDCLDWDAITIRCQDHDEMDILVRALKSCADSHVVPFSSNPKASVKKKRTSLSKKQDAKFKRKIRRKSSHIHESSKQTSQVHHQLKDESLDVSNKKSEMKTTNEDDKGPGTFMLTKNHTSLKNFNNNIYCELCHLHFTLLTRRHHCRKCDRSCCGDCSSLMLVKGGGEKRFCHRCSSAILRKQSTTLRNVQTKSIVIPGKVHEQCHRMGVGVMGKLPHWKNYLNPASDRRPAVGRISIEVIEAMALPTIDILNGKVDSYVRATITGYDRDMRWDLNEWLPNKRYSLCSSYCSATLSPQWRGPGGRGGEVLTLPVISTAGAVLRLEVLHYDIMTNSRGRDVVLGFVDIPLSDIPNANLRRPDYQNSGATKRRRKSGYNGDGFCDKWYRLNSLSDLKGDLFLLSKPISNPQKEKPGNKESSFRKMNNADANTKTNMNGNHSWNEIKSRLQGLCIAPVEWIGTALQIDLTGRKPENVFEHHKARSTIHVRIKLNASEVGDLLSHTWFPPVEPYPPYPPFDPQTLFNLIQRVTKLTEPYRNIMKFVEECAKWEREQFVCICSYVVFAIHLLLFPFLLHIFHFHLMIFFAYRLRQSLTAHTSELNDSWHFQSNRSNRRYFESKLSMECNDNFNNNDTVTSNQDDQEEQTCKPIGKVTTSPSLKRLDVMNCNSNDKTSYEKQSNKMTTPDEEETQKLNMAITWLAKRLGDNKGFEILQFKLKMLAQDLQNVNSLWDGSSVMKTKIMLAVLSLSFVIHCYVSKRLIWFSGTAIVYFAHCPSLILMARTSFGFWRGTAKTMRRRQLHEMEVTNEIQYL